MMPEFVVYRDGKRHDFAGENAEERAFEFVGDGPERVLDFETGDYA